MRDAVYTAREGDVLDQVVHAHYGELRPGLLEAVLVANPEIGDYPILPRGLAVTLPAAPASTSRRVVRLW